MKISLMKDDTKIKTKSLQIRFTIQEIEKSKSAGPP